MKSTHCIPSCDQVQCVLTFFFAAARSSTAGNQLTAGQPIITLQDEKLGFDAAVAALGIVACYPILYYELLITVYNGDSHQWKLHQMCHKIMIFYVAQTGSWVLHFRLPATCRTVV